MPKSLFIASLLAVSGITACAHLPTPSEPIIVTTAPLQAISNADFTTTNTHLKTAIESRGLTLFTTVDHAAGAAKIGQDLAPNTLYIFGNPKGGTPLILANPALGLDLPLKAQVREQDGQVLITVTDIRAITSSAGVSEPAQVITNIEGALNAIMTEAAGS